MNVKFSQLCVNFKLGKLFQFLILLLLLTYLLNLCLSYFGFNYSLVFQVSYLAQLFLVIYIHFKYGLKVNRWFLALFLFSFCTTVLGVIFANLNFSKIPIDTPLIFLLTAVLFPLMIANLFLRCLNTDFSKSLYLVFNYVIFKSTLYIILIPLELIAMNRSGFSILQFTGGQYHNIGILLLTLSCAYYFGIEKKIVLVLNILLFITVFFSFSRVSILLYLVVIVYFAFLGLVKLIFENGVKNYLFLIGIILVLLSISNYSFSNEYINDFFNYWMLRLNQVGDDFDYNNIFEEGYVESGRGMVFELFYRKVNFLNLLFGYGIGSSQYILSDFSNGELRFGSFHNLILTVIAERGFLLGSFFVLFIIYMAILLLKKKNAIFFFMLFLVFSMTTGVELFVNSRDLNFDITILLMIFFSAARFNKYSQLA